MILALIALVSALSGAPETPPQSPSAARADGCEIDTSALLKLTPDQFDQDIKGGWRALGDRPGCEAAAANLIAAYRKAHWGSLSPDDLHISYWHEGQARAMAGHYDEAVPLLMAGVNPETGGGGGFEDYALGTVAFLDRDLPALKAARARLAKTPEPPGWAQAVARYKAKWHQDLKWPTNLDVLDSLIGCFDKPYREAYGNAKCRGG